MNKIVLLGLIGALVLAIGLWFVWSVSQGFVEHGWKTVKGPESPELREALGGKVFTFRPIGVGNLRGSIDAIDVRSKERTNVVQLDGCVVAMDEAHGQLAYLVMHFDGKGGHELVLFNGTNQRVVKSWASSFYSPIESPRTDAKVESAGRSIALSNDGRRLAMVLKGKYSNVDPVDGQLVAIDLASGQSQVLQDHIVDGGLAWLPDDSHLVFVKSTSDSPGPDAPQGNDFGRGIGERRKAVISVLDVKSKEVIPICDGVNPLVSPDGKHILCSDPGGSRFRKVLIEDKAFSDVPSGTFENGWRQPFALTNAGQVLAIANPTATGRIGYTKASAIKIIDPRTGKFATIWDGDTVTEMCLER